MQNKTELAIIAGTFAGIFFQPICVVAFVAACANYAHKRHLDARKASDMKYDEVSKHVDEMAKLVNSVTDAQADKIEDLEKEVKDTESKCFDLAAQIQDSNKVLANHAQNLVEMEKLNSETKRMVQEAKSALGFKPFVRQGT